MPFRSFRKYIGCCPAAFVAVALVTAAAYPGEPHKMEVRISGLLRSLAFAIECGAPPDIVSRFHGACACASIETAFLLCMCRS